MILLLKLFYRWCYFKTCTVVSEIKQNFILLLSLYKCIWKWTLHRQHMYIELWLYIRRSWHGCEYQMTHDTTILLNAAIEKRAIFGVICCKIINLPVYTREARLRDAYTEIQGIEWLLGK